MRYLVPLSLAALAALATGCVHPEVTNEYEPEFEGAVDPSPVVVREVTVGYESAGEPGAVALGASLPASPRDRPVPDPVPFRLGAGRGVLGSVDLAPCTEDGLPRGYLHMRVTFRRSGRIVHAAVESPAAPPPEALSCIAEQLEAALVPTFDGGDVTLSKSYYVN